MQLHPSLSSSLLLLSLLFHKVDRKSRFTETIHSRFCVSSTSLSLCELRFHVGCHLARPVCLGEETLLEEVFSLLHIWRLNCLFFAANRGGLFSRPSRSQFSHPDRIHMRK